MKPGFVREVYLRSTPSVDLELVTEQVDCTKHTIPKSVYDAIVEEYSETKDDQFAAEMFMQLSGPEIIDDIED